VKNFPKDPDHDYSVATVEMRIQERLEDKGFYLETQHNFVLQDKNVDFYDYQTNFVAEIDGEQVHANKREKDTELRDRIRKRYGCTLREYSYHYPCSIRREKEITAEIIDNVVGLRRGIK